ncbi:MAG: S9 family peptidase, partial [Chthoniobacteraceae bacterium]
MKRRAFPSPALVIAMSALLHSIAPAAYPPSEKKPVTDEYHGERITDEYRWLEDSGSPAVKAWTDAQNAYTRKFLDALPDRAGIEAQLTALYAKDTPSHSGLVARPGRLFALKFQPPKQQRLLVMLKSADDLASEKVVLDPNELEPKGQVAMDWFVPSPDGKLIAVCLSEHGSEDGTLHFYHTDTGEHLPDRIPRVQYPTGGGSAAWTPDSKAVFFTRYPHKGERPEEDANFYQQIWFHTLGTPWSADTYSEGRDFPRIAEIHLETSRSGRWLIASVANGDGGEYAHYTRDMKDGDAAKWRQVTRFEDGVKEAAIGCDSATLFLRSVKDAPRGKVLRLSLDPSKTLKDAEAIVPEGEAVIEGITPTASVLYVSELIGGPSRIRQLDLDGKNPRAVPLPEASGVAQAVALEDDANDDRILVRQTSFIAPSAWMTYDPRSKEAPTPKKSALFNTSPVSFDDIEAVREFATGKDGTKVPVNILRRKGTKLDRSNPTLLTGYGGYGISMR